MCSSHADHRSVRVSRHARTLALLVAISACGGTSSDSDIETAPMQSSPQLASLAVTDECATVTLADGTVWGESCLTPSPSRPLAAVSESIDGVELALIRVSDGVEMVGAEPVTVRMLQSDGWVLVESIDREFNMTFARSGVEVACEYNPAFINCEDAHA
jgi:hypothetical protein